MRKFINCLIFLLFGSMNAASSADEIADQDCSFNQEHQVQVLRAMANRFPGGQLDIKNRTIQWKQSATDGTQLNFGGCFHLASGVTQTIRLSQARTQAQVFALAKFLAKRYWDNQLVSAGAAFDALVAALNAGKYAVSYEEGKTIYAISDETYDELTVSHSYQNGIDTVMIVWFGAF